MNILAFQERWAAALTLYLTFFASALTDLRAADSLWKYSFDGASYGSGCQAARLSSDGKLLAVACRDKSIRIWDVQSGREVRRLIGHTDTAKWMSFSPDASRLVSSSIKAYSYSPFLVWSVATGELLYEHKSRSQLAGAVEYHPAGKYFAVGMRNIESDGRHHSNTTELFDATSFRPVRRLAESSAFRERLLFARSGNEILLGHGNGYAAEIINLASGQRRSPGAELKQSVFHPEGRYVAGIEGGRELVILDGRDLKPVRRIAIPKTRDGKSAGSLFRCVQFHPDGSSVLAATSDYWIEWSLSDGEIKRGGKLEYAGKSIILITSDGRQMVEVGAENRMVMWDLKTAKPVARFYCLDTPGEWAMETSSGFFQHSAGVQPGLIAPVSPEQRESWLDDHHKPRIVARLLAGMSVADALALPESGVPPTVNLTLVATEQDFATISIVAATQTPEAGIADVLVSVNGRELATTQTKALAVHAAGSNVASAGLREKRFTTRVSFLPGQNEARVQVVAQDSLGQRSSPATLRIERPQKVSPIAGRLFVLAVGVSEYENPSFNLRFADRDATAVAERLLLQKGRAFGDVQVKVYTNKKATRTNLKEGLAWLQESCTESDVAVVLFSGHGITREKGLYYVTHEANLDGVQFTCLNWETIAESLKVTRARQILFLADACYAGAFGESDLAPQQELADSLRRTAGVMVFTSSRGDEVSLENPEWGHGAFCAAILDGLDGKADANGDGAITIAELQSSVTLQVAELTNDRQHPDLPKLGDFDPDLVIARIRNKISNESN